MVARVIPLTAAVFATAILTSCTSSGPAPATPRPTDQAAGRPAVSSSPGCVSSSAVVVGVKVDQYGTGYLDVRNYSYQGFDVDIATYISSALFGTSTPYFLPVSSDSREQVLTACAIRFFAATYTITPDRQMQFDLAGPYLVTFQGVMVGPHSPRISTVNDLNRRRVCVVGKGSQAEAVLQQYVPAAIPVGVDTYSTCLALLRDGNVDAFSVDLAILYGYLTNRVNGDLSIIKGLTIGNPIYYGIAFRKSDHALCLRAAAAIATMLTSKQWTIDIGVDLPNYVADQGLYPEPLMPSGQQIDQNSCVTP